VKFSDRVTAAMNRVLWIAFACLLTSTCFSTVIYVPADQPTIQAGINAANNGDTVLVSPGTYTENINFNGKVITVKSSGGAKLTVIDGNKAAPCATFSSGESLKAVLEGFTLTNGAGSGVSISYSSPTVTKNIIRSNTGGSGGGIDSYFSSPVITHNTIEKNTAAIGGGIYVGGASSPGAVITNNVIESNVAYEFGGGVGFDAAGTALLEDNTIAKNSASGSQGGGIWMVNESDELIIQNLIYSNTGGSGSQIYSSVPESETGFRMVNNTIVSTASGADGAVIAIIVNNIIVASGSEAGILCNPIYQDGPPQVEFNDVLSPQGISYGDSCTGFDGTNGNISANPLFVSKHNFRLQSGSPAIDAGTTSAPDLPLRDFANKPRIVDGTIDMGAYESQ
jgi:parallel beta-helix repeat protein